MRLEEKITREGLLVKKSFVEVPEERPHDVKMEIRKDIRDEVYDTEDAIADGFKLSLANTSMIYKLFTLITNHMKNNNMEDELRKVVPAELETGINEVMAYYEKSTTLLDLKIKQDGFDFLKRIVDRQSEIAKIVEEKLK